MATTKSQRTPSSRYSHEHRQFPAQNSMPSEGNDNDVVDALLPPIMRVGRRPERDSVVANTTRYSVTSKHLTAACQSWRSS